MTSPDLSIVVAAQGTPQQTSACLRSLLAQRNIDSTWLEIIVAEGPPYASTTNLEEQFPSVKFIRASGPSIPVLHGAGIHASTAGNVAITEAHCTFDNDWFNHALESLIMNDASVVGGCVCPGKDVRNLNMALFLCDYAQFIPPMDSGPNTDLPGNNIVFTRASLGDTERFVEHGFWKTFFCYELAAMGHNLVADSSLIVDYNRKLSVSEIVFRRFHHGRCFGAMRAQHTSPSKRLIHFLSGPFLPFLLMYKLSQRCRLGQRYVPRNTRADLFLANIPAAFACQTIWSIGEWIGNMAGSGSSCEKL
jgi:hypothetical protein